MQKVTSGFSGKKLAKEEAVILSAGLEFSFHICWTLRLERNLERVSCILESNENSNWQRWSDQPLMTI